METFQQQPASSVISFSSQLSKITSSIALADDITGLKGHSSFKAIYTDNLFLFLPRARH